MRFIIIMGFVISNIVYASDIDTSQCRLENSLQMIKLNCTNCDQFVCIGKMQCKSRSGIVRIDLACDSKGGACPSLESCLNDKSVSVSKAQIKDNFHLNTNSNNHGTISQ